MLTSGNVLGQPRDRVALKDERLVYRACSMAFAQCVGQESPEQVIGRTDFDLFPGEIAREQMALDSQTMFLARADISAINLTSVGNHTQQAMIVRRPVVANDNLVRGVDVRLLGGPALNAPPSAIAIDYQTLVNDGIQGSLIMTDSVVLFANDNAAHVLGYPSAQAMMDGALVSDLFSEQEHGRALAVASRALTVPVEPGSQRVNLEAKTHHGALVRLIARSTFVQWGSSRATLLSFVDVALPDISVSVQSDTRVLNSSIVNPPEAAEQSFLSLASQREMPVTIESLTGEGEQVTRVAATPGATVTRAQAIQPDKGAIAARKLTEKLMQQVARIPQLRANEQRYRHYASSAADFFFELDANLTFRVVSEGFVRVLDVPREHIIGRSHAQLLDHPSNVNEPGHWEAHLQRMQDCTSFRDFEFRWSTDSGTRVVRYSAIPVFNRAQEFVGYRGVGCDVTTAVRQAEKTAYYANHDALTGLVNRRRFENTVSDALQSSRENRESHALCFMDLDSFKIVNDTCGHQAGDELLRQLTQLFDSLVRKSDVLARLGGDEFGVLLYKCSVPEALKLANQIRHEVENFQFLWKENRFTIGVSVGLVVVDDRWESMDSLFNAADSACYIAKNEGRNRVVVYREGEGNASNRNIATHWVEEINSALESDRLRLACQKILPLHRQSEGLRFEMLLRLEMPDGELVSPKSFLPTAERYGLISSLDGRAIQLTLSWLSDNVTLQKSIRHVSLNLSAASFTSKEFTLRLVESIQNSGVPADKLCFEISETAIIANLSHVGYFMDKLSALGCRFSIDGFGSGLSSFAYLRKLPVDFLKIDGLLIKDIFDDKTDFTLVKAISDISKSMGKRTIAEFIESPELLNAVRDIGIDFGQGYHLGEPELIS